MMINQTLGDTLKIALNNPDCAITIGMMMGAIFIVRWLFALWCLYVLTKVIDKLALNPLLDWIKIKIYKRSNNAKQRR